MSLGSSDYQQVDERTHWRKHEGEVRHLHGGQHTPFAESTRSWGVDLEHSSVLYDRPLFHREVPAADVDTPAAIPWNDATGVPYCQRLALRHISS